MKGQGRSSGVGVLKRRLTVLRNMRTSIGCYNSARKALKAGYDFNDVAVAVEINP